MTLPPPNISVLIYTAREDFPYQGSWMHCFEPVVRTLNDQTFRYFELVIVDALWEKRRDYFIGKESFYPITHVPASPNVWHERGRPGLCAQLNRGLAWCDGELVWIGAENNLFPPHFLQTAWEVYFYQKKIPVAWYAILGPREERRQPQKLHPVVEFNLCGFTEQRICDVDHRAERFVLDPKLTLDHCHHQNYFAYAGLPLELAYDVNGFDEAFDGDLSALDVDLGSRITMLRGEGCLAMHRDLWLMEPPTIERWVPEIQRRQPMKCGYALWWYNRLNNRVRVNVARSPGFVDDVKNRVCRDACPVKGPCASKAPGWGESIFYPFCEGPDVETTKFWIENQPVRDLTREAKMRRIGEFPYDRCTRVRIC